MLLPFFLTFIFVKLLFIYSYVVENDTSVVRLGIMGKD